MRFVIAAAIALAIALFCTKTIKNTPFILYACALLADALYAYAIIAGANGGFWTIFLPLIQRCTLAMAFFAIVMLTGVFKDGSTAKSKLMPIRRQLSITAAILASCHVVFYAQTYIAQIAGIVSGNASQSALAANLFVSLGISLLITALLAMLTATSFVAVKTRMHAATWKKVQRFAYAFYALVFVHLAIILMPPALAGKDAALESICAYTALFLAYAGLRIRRYVLDVKRAYTTA
ncbi:MAG: ferric reductase-like transmembrane domain-containing protein [Slackia sp.]|nr:ferric reductase-like transmembrane domain-containing protein [Slackia sp.]